MTRQCFSIHYHSDDVSGLDDNCHHCITFIRPLPVISVKTMRPHVSHVIEFMDCFHLDINFITLID